MKTKACKYCGEEKPTTDFRKHPTNADRLARACRDCCNALKRERYHKNPEKFNKAGKLVLKGLYEKFFDMYGRECSCCGDNRRVFLTFDHVVPVNGKRKRRGCSTELREALKKHDPNRYQTLCMNCNFLKSNKEKCPCGTKYGGLNG